MLVILIRTIIIYIILILVMRMTGKRQIGELQVSEFVTALMLSELAVQPITNINIPLFYAIMPILTLISFEIIISYLVAKSKLFKKLFEGEPSFIIRHGALDQNELIKQRISMDEFIGELRQKDISDINDVNYAILEQNGKLSVFPKSRVKAVTAADLSVNTSEDGIAFPIVMDGDINFLNLKLVGRNELWLIERLAERKIKTDNVFLFTVDDNGNEYLILKD